MEVEAEQSQISEIHASWKNVLFNRSFLLLLASWVLVGGSVRACMVHEPQRIVHLGYSMKNGADSLAINGAVQFASRKSQLVFLSSKSRSNLSINLGYFLWKLLESANIHSSYIMKTGTDTISKFRSFACWLIRSCISKKKLLIGTGFNFQTKIVNRQLCLNKIM